MKLISSQKARINTSNLLLFISFVMIMIHKETNKTTFKVQLRRPDIIDPILGLELGCSAVLVDST